MVLLLKVSKGEVRSTEGRPVTASRRKLLLLLAFCATTLMQWNLRKKYEIIAAPEFKGRGGVEPPIYGTNKTLPNVLLVGSPKAGTSAISEWLYNNGVCRPRVFEGELFFYRKEVHFFDLHGRYKKGAGFYKQRFEHCQDNNSVVLSMDATPNYLSQASRIHTMYKSVGEETSLKIIVSIREPVARELSWYNHLSFQAHNDMVNNPYLKKSILRNDGAIKSFEEFTTEVHEITNDISKGIDPAPTRMIGNFGMYAYHLSRWFDLFKREKKILILSYEELQNAEQSALSRVKHFLGQDFTGKLPRANTKDSPFKVAMPPCTIQNKLSKVFAPMNEDFYKLLDSHPGPWMEQRPFPKFQLGKCVPD